MTGRCRWRQMSGSCMFSFLSGLFPHLLHGLFSKNSIVCQFMALGKVILKQPVREKTCLHTARSFILVWFSCFTVWLSQSFLIHFKAEFGDSKVFWGCLADTVRLLAQTYKHNICITRHPRDWPDAAPLLTASEGLGSYSPTCLLEPGGFTVLISIYFGSCQVLDHRTSVKRAMETGQKGFNLFFLKKKST